MTAGGDPEEGDDSTPYFPFTKDFASRFCPVIRTFFAAANFSIGPRTSFVFIKRAVEMFFMPEPRLC